MILMILILILMMMMMMMMMVVVVMMMVMMIIMMLYSLCSRPVTIKHSQLQVPWSLEVVKHVKERCLVEQWDLMISVVYILLYLNRNIIDLNRYILCAVVIIPNSQRCLDPTWKRPSNTSMDSSENQVFLGDLQGHKLKLAPEYEVCVCVCHPTTNLS